MRILHLFDQSILDNSEYSLRCCAIVSEQQKLGLVTKQLVIDSGISDRADESHVVNHDANVENPADDEGDEQRQDEQGVDNPAGSLDKTRSDSNARMSERYLKIDGIDFQAMNLSGLFSNIPILKYCRDYFQLRTGLRKLIEAFQPQVIHAHSPAIVGLAALQLGAVNQIPVVYELCGLNSGGTAMTKQGNKFAHQLHQKLESHVIRHANAVTVANESLRREALERGANEDLITLVRNGANVVAEPSLGDIDLKKVAKDLKRQLGLENKILLGYVGEFRSYEGLDLIMQALPILLQGLPDLHLLLVGAGEEEENLKHMAAKLGLSGQVTFTGKMRNAKLAQFFNVIDVLICPRLSTPYTEGVEPLLVLQALANGSVILASDVGGHHQIIRHGDNGFLFKKDDKNALADTLVDVLNEKSAWPHIRERGKSYIKNERDWSSAISAYKHLYSKIAVHEDA